MDSKFILLQCIALLFHESQLDSRTSDSKALVKQAINTIKLPEASITLDQNREILVSLRATTLYMVELEQGARIEHDHFIQRIRVGLAGDASLLQTFEKALTLIDNESDTKRRVLDYRKSLNGFIREINIKESLKKFYTQTHFSDEPVDWRNIVPEILGEMEKYNLTDGDGQPAGVVDAVDFDNIASIEDAVERSQKENTSEGMISSGWQGQNRLTGGTTFYRRGDFVVVGALQHNFKSGWMNSHARDIPMYNTPYMIDPTKKPLILGITTENSVKDNLMWLYSNLKGIETGEAVDVRTVSPGEISRYVKEKLEVNGYAIKMYRVDPSDYSFRDFFDLILRLESEGYEIHACLFDYLNMISKKGIEKGPMGSDIRELFRRVRNFCSPRGILFMTPHQLSSEAKALLRTGISSEDFVKEIANKGYWDSCRVIDQEVDLEIYIHIVNRDGVKWITVMRGKHRKFEITDEKDLYYAMKFDPVTTLPPDIGGVDRSVPKVGANKTASGQLEMPWYD